MEIIKREKLLFNETIDLGEFGIIYQPKLKDFLNEFSYERFKRAFSVRKDLYIDEDNEDYNKIENFDLIFYLNVLEDLVISLNLLYRADGISIEASNEKDLRTIRIAIKSNEKTYYINRENYTRFSDMILVVLHDKENVVKEEEEISEELSEIEKKIARKRREYERKKAKKEAEQKNKEEPITIFDLANYIIHENGTTFNYQNVLELTIYQLINTFTLYRQKEGYNFFMNCRSSGLKIEDETKHWFFNK